MRTFIDVAAGLQGGVKSIDTKDLFTTGTINSQSVVIPSGASTTSEYSLFNYLKIQNYLRKEIDKHGTEKNSDETEKAGVQE